MDNEQMIHPKGEWMGGWRPCIIPGLSSTGGTFGPCWRAATRTVRVDPDWPPVPFACSIPMAADSGGRARMRHANTTLAGVCPRSTWAPSCRHGGRRRCWAMSWWPCPLSCRWECTFACWRTTIWRPLPPGESSSNGWRLVVRLPFLRQFVFYRMERMH